MAITEPTQNSISLHSLEMGVQTSLYPSSTFDPDYSSHVPVKEVRYAQAKRVLDILFSLVGLILFSWIFMSKLVLYQWKK
jgi:lipopolysaccharide/colanic/teichoic acid biosynthesis glycosyltransferase